MGVYPESVDTGRLHQVYAGGHIFGVAQATAQLDQHNRVLIFRIAAASALEVAIPLDRIDAVVHRKPREEDR